MATCWDQGGESPNAWDTCCRPHVLRQAGTPRTAADLGSCPSPARRHGDSRITTGYDGQKLTYRVWEHFPAHAVSQSARLHGGTPTSSKSRDPIRDSYAVVIPGSARTRHRFGDEVLGPGDLLTARRNGCQAEGWGARLDCIPCAPPLGLAGTTRAARRSPLNRTVRRNHRPRPTPGPADVGGDAPPLRRSGNS